MELISTILFIAAIIFVARHLDAMGVDKKKRERKSEIDRAQRRIVEDSARKIFRPLESPIEETLFKILDHKSGLVTQYPVYSYIENMTYRLDFAFPNEKIAIEADGHDFHQTRDAKLKDAQRDAALAKEGWVVYRYQGSLIERHPDYVRREIEKIIN